MARRWQCEAALVLVLACGDDGGGAPADTIGPVSTTGDTHDATQGHGSSGGPGPSAASDTNPSSGPTPQTSSASSSSGDPSTGEAETDTPPQIWAPPVGTTWQWQLTETIDTSVDVEVYDIDLFDVGQSVIDGLHADGRVVICYFSAGSYEEWRPDADSFGRAAIGNPLEQWPGEAWLDHRDAGIREVMRARLDLAVDKSCDAVEPDNIDGYTNNTGFDLSGADQLDYNRFLADEAHARGLSIGLKNDVDQVGELVDDFDWALNEECMSYRECDTLDPFIESGKAVFHVEYVDDPADGPDLARTVCPDGNARAFSSLVKEWDLGPWLIEC